MVANGCEEKLGKFCNDFGVYNFDDGIVSSCKFPRLLAFFFGFPSLCLAIHEETKEPSRGSREPVNGHLPENRSDGWKEIELREVVCHDENNGEVDMKLVGIDGYFWKSVLIVQALSFA